MTGYRPSWLALAVPWLGVSLVLLSVSSFAAAIAVLSFRQGDAFTGTLFGLMAIGGVYCAGSNFAKYRRGRTAQDMLDIQNGMLMAFGGGASMLLYALRNFLASPVSALGPVLLLLGGLLIAASAYHFINVARLSRAQRTNTDNDGSLYHD